MEEVDGKNTMSKRVEMAEKWKKRWVRRVEGCA